MSNNFLAHKSNAGNLLLGVFAIATIRDFLEVALEGKLLLKASDVLSSIKTYFLHFNFFYLLVYVSLSIILYSFSRKNSSISECFKAGALAMTLIWIAPLFDFFVFDTFDMFYPNDPMNVICNIHHLGDPNYTYEGLTMGMRLEIILAGMGGVGYLYYKTKSTLSAIFGGVCISMTCLTIGLIVPFITQLYDYGFQFGYHKLYDSTLLNLGFIIHGNASKIALFYIFLCLILFSIAYYIRSPKCFLAIVGNFRWTRAIHYLLLFLLGLLYIYNNPPVQNTTYDGDFEFLTTIWSHPLDLFGIFMASIAIFLSFQSAVIINDIYDYEIDVISNANRPLVSKVVSLSEYFLIGKLFAIIALTISFCINETFFFFVLLYNLMAFLYSSPPFRLRKYFMVSNFVLAVIFIITFHSGTTVLFSNYKFENISPNITFVLLLCYALAITIKDFKDIEGDKNAHIQTLYTLLGKKVGNVFMALFVCCAVLIPPVLLHITQLMFYGVLICLLFLLIITFIKNSSIKERLVISLYYVNVLVLFYYIIL